MCNAFKKKGNIPKYGKNVNCANTLFAKLCMLMHKNVKCFNQVYREGRIYSEKKENYAVHAL